MPFPGRSVQWPHCDGTVGEAEHLDLVYVLGFRLLNDRGFRGGQC